MGTYAKDIYTRDWIIENALDEIENYEKGILTIRALHYRLVSRGMTNTQRHYKRVVEAMVKARWDGRVDFDTFSDRDRELSLGTSSDTTDLDGSVSYAKRQIKAWSRSYSKNTWENQPIYPEVWIEKKALLGVFESVCMDNDVGLAACKGYPSLTFLNEAAERFIYQDDQDRRPVILYFGDYDPSGEDIPRSLKENLQQMGANVEVKRICLLKDQVLAWGLPPAPAKKTDSRTANWDGLGQVELDAVEPKKLQELIQAAIDEVKDDDLYQELMDEEASERTEYRQQMRDFLNEEFNE